MRKGHENKERYMGRFSGWNGKEEMMNYNIKKIKNLYISVYDKYTLCF